MKPRRVSWRVIAPLGLILFLAAPVGAQIPAWVQQERQSAIRKATPIDVRGQRRGTAVVDWPAGYILVKIRGTADPNMCVTYFQCEGLAARAAKTLAYAELARIVKGVNVSATSIVRDAMAASMETRAFVRGFVRGARQIGETTFRRGRGEKEVQAEVTMGILIQGGLTRGILQIEYKKPPLPARRIYRPKTFTVKLRPPKPVLLPTGKPEGSAKPSTTTSIAPGAVYTGVIVDASGLGARPALVAKLRTPDLKVFYGTHLVPRELAMNFGLAGYAGSREQARETHKTRIGQSPLVVKGLRAYGSRKADIVLSDRESQKVVLADLKGKFLQKAKVVIIIDR